MKTKLLCFLCAAIALFSACSTDLDRARATDLFETSPDIPRALAEEFILHRTHTEPTVYIQACKKHGLVTYEGYIPSFAWYEPEAWQFSLTEEGTSLVSKDIPSQDENKTYLRVCSLKVKEVTGILFLNEDKTKACIEYVLTFDDITKAGEMWNDFAFAHGNKHNSKLVPGRTAAFKALADKYDDGWRLTPPKEGEVGRTYLDWWRGKDWCEY